MMVSVCDVPQYGQKNKFFLIFVHDFKLRDSIHKNRQFLTITRPSASLCKPIPSLNKKVCQKYRLRVELSYYNIESGVKQC